MTSKLSHALSKGIIFFFFSLILPLEKNEKARRHIFK